MPIAQSNHIYAHDYDQDSKTLTIQFTNGAMYSYAGVDPTIYHTLSQSNSPGTYFHSKIKGSFTGTLLTPGPRKKR